MRVTTLKASAAKLPALLEYYAGLAEDHDRSGPGRGPVDYYLDPDEPPGRWWGNGRHALGLDGTVTGDELRSLLEGEHPGLGVRLGRSFGEKSARGFDATFSAPKSVSVLWALTPDAWVRAEVLAAHDTAVDAALGWFEHHGAVTRRGTDGVFQVDTQGVTAALFRQHTSRTVDPQLHTHAIISAKVQDATGKWLSLDARFLKYQQRGIGWIYDAALRAELTARLGVGWTDANDAVRDLTCIPEEVNEEFSSRTEQVDAKLAELILRWSDENYGADPDPRTIAELQRKAVIASRPSKSHGAAGEILHMGWSEQAYAVRFDLDQLTADHLAVDQLAGLAEVDEDLIDEALMRVSEEMSTWLRADLARHLAITLEPNAAHTGAGLVAEIDRLAELAEQLCTPLGPTPTAVGRVRSDGRPVTEHVTDRHLSTPRILREEERLQNWAAASTRRVPSTGDAQRDAATAIAGDAPLVVVVGPAGTGKTRTTANAVTELHAQGRPVVGLAPSGKAAGVLRVEAGCPTDTLAGFLTRHHHQATPWPAGTTVILDEAGMTATTDLAHLVDLVEENRWRLAVVGDPEQLPAVARGGVFAHWCNTIAHHTLGNPRRFTEKWEAAASLGLRTGDPDAAQTYADRGRLRSAHPALVAAQVARAHQHHTAAGRTVAITTNTADTARAINREIQRQRRQRNTERVALHDGTVAMPGDRIATRRNDPRLRVDTGERVRNRHIWTVDHVDADGAITAHHDQRGTVTLPADYVAEHVELGWAVTGYGNQGDTVDIGIAVLEPSTSRNHAYVAMTRGRTANHALIIDPTGTTDPAEQLAEIIARPARAESALAVRERLYRVAGIRTPAHDKPVAAQSTEPGPPTPTGETQGDLATHHESWLKMQQRLDRLQHAAPDSGRDQGFGL